VKIENYKQKIQIKELEKKLAKLSSQDQNVDQDFEIRKKTQNDKVIQNIEILIKKIEKEAQVSTSQLGSLSKELKVLTTEIESYNNKIAELTEKEKELMKGGIGGSDKRDLQKANNALKTAIHQKLVEKEKEKFDLQSKVENAKNTIDEMNDNGRIYTRIKEERKKTLVNEYLMKNQDDLEKILETLYMHFQHVQRTAFESMSRDNLDFVGSKEILIRSNNELKRLSKELNSYKMEKDDIRYDIFKMIYDMIQDNINLRLKVNNYIDGILE
jgi:chromosome segregation ATPase